jgi:hypothetical protein
MGKGSTLSQSLKAVASGKPKVEAIEVASAKVKSNVDTVLIGAHFAPEVRRVLKLIEADSGKRLKPLLGEAINMLAARYGKPEPFHDED